MKLKAWHVMFAVLAVAAGYWLYAQSAAGPGAALSIGVPSLAAQAQAFEQKYAGDFITYANPTDGIGFSVKYPVGYVASDDAGLNTLQLTAQPAFGNAEVLFLQAAKDLDLKDFEAGARVDLEAGIGFARRETTVDGRTVVVLSSLVPYPELENERAFVTHALYSCAEKGYSAALSAVVPEELAPDVDMVNYVIHSFRC